MSQLNDKIITRWARNIALGENKHIPSQRSTNISVRDDAVFSYGWWEMARLIRDKKGKPSFFLINGDTYSVQTSRQQSDVRDVINGITLPHPPLILPYSVLGEAGIDLDSVLPLEIAGDRWETIEHLEHEFPERAVWEYEHESLPGTGVYVHRVTGETLSDRGRYVGNAWVNEWEVACRKAREEYQWKVDDRDPASPYSYEARVLREEKFKAQWTHYPLVTKNTGRKTLDINRGWGTWDLIAPADPDADPAAYDFHRTTRRHWLGASLVTGRLSYWAKDGSRKTRTARYLSAFDENETRPSYFFCELPATSRASTIEQAYADLKPATVKTAEALGRDVKRQGDIYAVPVPTVTTASLTKAGATRTKRGVIFGTNHVATETASVGRLTYARGTISHAPEGRRPDHKRLTIGKEWHLLVKNTVPVTA